MLLRIFVVICALFLAGSLSGCEKTSIENMYGPYNHGSTDGGGDNNFDNTTDSKTPHPAISDDLSCNSSIELYGCHGGMPFPDPPPPIPPNI